MNVGEFRDGIEKGLGRAILFLQDHPSKDYFDVILNACLHDTCYDAQCEHSRADYLFEAIRLTQEQSLFEDQILAEISVGNKLLNIRSYLLVWGKEASTEELEWIVADLLKETDENKLTGYLYIFLYREFPLNYNKLLDLDLSPNEEVALAAIKSLKNIRDSSIHDLAISLIQKKLFYSEALELLVKNYQDNDYLLIEQVIEQEFDSDGFQDIASSIIKIFKQNPTPHSLNTMLQIYQKGECSHCREKCVEVMISTKTIPHNIIEECHYDANPDIRKLVS